MKNGFLMSSFLIFFARMKNEKWKWIFHFSFDDYK